jgi:hypothetical protein
MRGTRPFLFSNLKEHRGVLEIARFILEAGGLALVTPADAGADRSPEASR